ncbi:MAG: sigma-54 dependent transcriptional regulator [Verrucomicrobiota bacterium]
MADDKQKILIIDDEVDVHLAFRRLLEKEPLEIETAANGDEGIKKAGGFRPDLIVMDIRMGNQSGLDTLKELRRRNPKQTVIMMTAYGTSQTAIEAMKLGAYDYVLKPFDIPQLKSMLNRALESAGKDKVAPKRSAQLSPEDLRQTIVGNSPAMQQVYKLIGQVANTQATILITGESGTGKELVARAIFQHSTRAAKPFIAINCAAIPENLLESELFGHEKGAFTGAMSQRVGKFEQCDGGTLFLDEIGDMPLTTQTKILRVLQEGEISRLGSNNSIKTDVRILAATNKDLWECVQEKTFREDLYYRLNVVRLHLPPLRERKEDLNLLIAFFVSRLRQVNGGGPSQISEEALEALAIHGWPGNVRELQNCIQRAMVMATGDTITLDCLPSEVTQSPAIEAAPAPPAPADAAGNGTLPAPPAGEGDDAFQRALDVLFAAAKADSKLQLLPAAERELIVRALAETNGNQVRAAKMLGITRATLRKRVEKFGIQRRLEID